MTKYRRTFLAIEAPVQCPPRDKAAGSPLRQWLVATLLTVGLAASAPAQIMVTGSYSSTDSYWTGGGGKNGTIGGGPEGNADGTLTVEGGSVLNLKNAYFGSGTAGPGASVFIRGFIPSFQVQLKVTRPARLVRPSPRYSLRPGQPRYQPMRTRSRPPPAFTPFCRTHL